MPYTPSEPAYATDPFALIEAGRRSQPLSMEDVDLAQRRLERLGLDETLVGRANKWRGRMVDRRDGARNELIHTVDTGGASTNDGALKGAAKSALGGVMKASM